MEENGKNCELIIKPISVKEKSLINFQKRHTEVTKFDNHDRDTTNKHHCVNLCSATI